MRILVTLLLVAIIGCQHSDSDQELSPLVGQWITESCDQVSNHWTKAIYEFTAQGTIRLGNELYSDSNCIVLVTALPPEESIAVPMTYQDHGPRLLQEGIDGRSISIQMGKNDQIASADAFYTINNGSLCFSDSITLEAVTFGVAQSGGDAIDFDNCLTRP